MEPPSWSVLKSVCAYLEGGKKPFPLVINPLANSRMPFYMIDCLSFQFEFPIYLCSVFYLLLSFSCEEARLQSVVSL